MRQKTLALAVAALACAGYTGAAQAQAGKFGAYTGTVTVSGTEMDGNTSSSFGGTIKITIPVTSRSDRAGRAEVDDTGKPSATALITKWDSSGKASAPDSGGRINTWSCSLAGPMEVPMNAQGAIDLNYRAKTYAMFIALSALKPVNFNCKNSSSGAYKKSELVGFFFGTTPPQYVPHKTLPFTDPAQLTAKYKLEPIGAMKGRYGPFDQEWDLRLVK
jgi:hypothetical protein